MQLSAILERISAHIAQTAMTEAELSRRATGSGDTIRNWRRAVRDGKPLAPKIDTITAVARALGLEPSELINGPDAEPAPYSVPGMMDGAEPYVFREQPVPRDSQQLTLRALFGDRASQPATFRLTETLPGLGLMPGDIVVIDLTRRGMADLGELAIVRLQDGQRCVRRIVPPFLISGHPEQDAAPQRLDDPAISILAPVIGTIRGLI
jgi:transcriptional regulator with XRE-family HTH domain